MIKDNTVQLFLADKIIKADDWIIKKTNKGNYKLTVTYPSGRKYSRPYEEWRVVPTMDREERILFNKSKCTYTQIQSAVEIGKKYFKVKYMTSDKVYFIKTDNFELKKSTDIITGNLLKYYWYIATERAENAKKEKDIIIWKSVLSQFEKVVPCEETVLNAYITGVAEKREQKKCYIYPFGVNETQLIAVKNAFASQVSVIEGPPGTGKTQTVLNIIANIIIDGKTCAIVSSNNSAVENVYEKLEKVKLDHLIAKLGCEEKRKLFFAMQKDIKTSLSFDPVEKEEIMGLFQNVEQYLQIKNKAAQLQNLLDEILIEKNYMEEWRQQHPEIKIDYIRKYKLSDEKVVELSAYVKSILDKRLTLRDKWNLLIGFRIFKSKFLNVIDDRESFIFSLQYTYYEKMLEKIMGEKNELQDKLKQVNFDSNLEKLKQRSMDFLYQYANRKISKKMETFKIESYKNNFHSFLKQYPVIGSSSFSLISSIGNGYLLDYVIIDEASQQDLVPGILCFGCAKNVIVVGDRKQLPHIPTPTKKVVSDEKYDCTKNSLLDSVCKVFGEKIPRVILREHYRSHPKIIQFCNKQFYNGELIPMKEDKGEDALSLVYTALGNHMRNNKNQREIDSVLKSNETIGYLETGDEGNKTTTGFIAPYNNQVNLAEQMLPKEIIEKTVHKFQGRECTNIVFSTVLDKKVISKKQLNFVDNAALVNVAVSRAQERFMLVTGQNVFKKMIRILQH